MARGKHSVKRAIRTQLTRRRRSSIVLGLVFALLLGTGGGAAYGAFTASGSGSGSATVGSMLTVTVATAGSPSSPLLPDGAGDVVFSVTNPNSFPVALVTVTLENGGTITPDGSHAACTTTDSQPVVSLSVPSGDLPVAVLAHSTQTVDLAAAATMAGAATSDCQGATFNIPVTVTVRSS
jgi:hypothetical protein